MATEFDPNLTHQHGLSALWDHNFGLAKDLFTEARSGFEELGSRIDVGRVDRDFVRVYAGLGYSALRNASLASATEIHWEAYSNPHVATVEEIESAANEFAATLHVSSRVILAQYVEGGRAEFGLMAKGWRMAYSTLKSLDHPNTSYLEQVLTHGGLAIAVFGNRRDLEVAEHLNQDPAINNMTDKKRVAAAMAISNLIFARKFFAPVRLVPKIRVAVIDAVAGPYISKYQLD